MSCVIGYGKAERGTEMNWNASIRIPKHMHFEWQQVCLRIEDISAVHQNAIFPCSIKHAMSQIQRAHTIIWQQHHSLRRHWRFCSSFPFFCQSYIWLNSINDSVQDILRKSEFSHWVIGFHFVIMITDFWLITSNHDKYIN